MSIPSANANNAMDIDGDIVIKPSENCYNPDKAFKLIETSLNKVEVKPLPLTTPIYNDKAS